MDQLEAANEDPIFARLLSIANRLSALGDGEDDETVAARASLFLENALFNGWLALTMMPGAKTYIASGLRFDGAEDPMHAAMDLTVRWRGGKLPSEDLAELRAKVQRLETEWREMKGERDDARRAGGELAAAIGLFIARDAPGEPVADAHAHQALVQAMDAYMASRSAGA